MSPQLLLALLLVLWLIVGRLLWRLLARVEEGEAWAARLGRPAGGQSGRRG